MQRTLLQNQGSPWAQESNHCGGLGKDAPDHYLKPLLAQEIQDGITQKVVEPGEVSGYQPGRDGAAELRLAQSGRQQTHQGVRGDPTGRMPGGQSAAPEVPGEV